MKSICKISGMKLFLVVLLFYSINVADAYINSNRPDEGAEYADAKLKPLELLRKYKYPGEEHQVVTEDGYVLTIHRIPYGRVMSTNKTKGIVIMQHALSLGSIHWLLPGTKRGLGYILADSGYDVWMPNSRGNTYSLKHIKYNAKSPEYWDFSFHEWGIYDHPAVIDYALNVTGAKDVTFIGHSQGTTSFIVFNILRPEYNRKIRASFLLAPLVHFDHATNIPLRVASTFLKPLKFGADLLGIRSALTNNELMKTLLDPITNSLRPLRGAIFAQGLKLAFGDNLSANNSTFIDILVSAGAYGIGVKELVHYGQIVASKRFQYYDYGPKKNLQVYGEKIPPLYDLSKAVTPIHLYHSKNDVLGAPEDVRRLMTELPNVREKFFIDDDKFNHQDHIYCDNIIELEFDHLLKSIDNYYI